MQRPFKECMEIKRHDLWESLARRTAKEYSKRNGVPEDDALQTAYIVADEMRGDWGGSVISFPKDCRYTTSLRDAQIMREFNGHNHHALSVKYKLTENAIRKLLKRVKTQHFQLSQGKLAL